MPKLSGNAIPEIMYLALDEGQFLQFNPRIVILMTGARRCPGNDLVDASLWLLVSSMLATLNISKSVDDAGNVIEPEVVFDNPIFRYAVVRLFRDRVIANPRLEHPSHSSVT